MRHELEDELSDLAGLADALVLLADAGHGGEERCVRAMGAIAQQIACRVNALSGEIREALNDPVGYMGADESSERPLDKTETL